jgi:hypothetical protein
MTEVRHLHGDYNFTYCGEDASTLPMTFEVKETTCPLCLDFKAHMDADYEAVMAQVKTDLEQADRQERAASAKRQRENHTRQLAFEKAHVLAEERREAEAAKRPRRTAKARKAGILGRLLGR